MANLLDYSQFCDVGKPPRTAFHWLFAYYFLTGAIIAATGSGSSTEISRNAQLPERSVIMCHLFITAEISHIFDTS
jgi:hypothetical protein